MPEMDLAATLRAAAAGDGSAWRRLVEAYSGRVYGLMVKQCRDRELAEELTQATFVKVVEQLQKWEKAGAGETTAATAATAAETGPEAGAGYRELGRFEPWLFRIAMNKLRDEMRRRKRWRHKPLGPGRGSTRDDADAAHGPGRRAAGSQGAWGSGGGGGEGGGGGASAWLAAGAEAGEAGERPVDLLDRREQVQRLRQAIDELPEADRELLHLRHTVGLSFADIAATLEQPLGTVLARGHRALAKLRKNMQEDDA